MADRIPSVQQQLGSAGAPAEFTVNGVVWKVGAPTQKSKAVLEELIHQRAFRVAERASKYDPGALGRFDQRRDRGDYETYGPGWQEMIQTPRVGPALYLAALLREYHPNVTESEAMALLISSPNAANAALERMTPRFFDLLMEPFPPDQQAKGKAAMAEAIEQTELTS